MQESLYNVWQANLELWDSVITKRIDVQRLKLELKLNLVLKEQVSHFKPESISCHIVLFSMAPSL